MYVVGGGGGGYSRGGSYDAGADQDNASGVRSGHGRVFITWR